MGHGIHMAGTPFLHHRNGIGALTFGIKINGSIQAPLRIHNLLTTGETNAAEASPVIVKAFWESLRGELPKVH